ncbi:MAG: branched-chain amino acid ABC transporter permease [Deltaproteobacteria bacterium]|nr:branched-chain amino acid ABC transporter permease [Deltaproteobacteria bacterium]
MSEAGVKYRRERLDRGIKARSDTIYLVSSFKDMIYLLMPRVLPVAAMLILPLVLSGYWKKVFVYTCIHALLALSWDFLAACGMFSLGQAMFFGVGAFFAGAISYYFQWPALFAIPLATLGGGAFCAALLSSVVRLRGIYFAMITLVVPMLFVRLIVAMDVLGGSHGLSSLVHFENEWGARYLAVAAVLLCLFGFRRIMNEDYGLVFSAIKDDDRVVMSGGINIYWRKTQALFIAACFGCFAGAFMTYQYQFVGPSAFALDYTILPLAATALGGPGTFVGAVLGSAILVPLSEALRVLGGLRITFYCVVLIVCIIMLPEGIFHYISRKYQQFERLVEMR